MDLTVSPCYTTNTSKHDKRERERARERERERTSWKERGRATTKEVRLKSTPERMNRVCLPAAPAHRAAVFCGTDKCSEKGMHAQFSSWQIN